MTINNPPKQSEYQPPTLEKQDGLIDRVLIRIGDIVIQNFAFLVFITVVWGLFLLLFFGGIILIYTVGERFRELDEREQKRVILYQQQLDQILAPAEPKNEPLAKVDESEWFVALSNTAEATKTDQLTSIIDHSNDSIVSKIFLEQPDYIFRELATGENTWQVRCGLQGFVIETAYPCSITHSQLLNPSTLDEDIAISN
ncbi:MAG: hypothetical protein AAF385_11115 [Pseudomonadota bacterium]